jgi:acyl-CoA synthetase (AMP-forming)/AMP-acid ligase II
MYIRGGYNVYPAEVEAVLTDHPAVGRAAVVGVPDPMLGEVGVAFLVPAVGHEEAPDLSLDDVRTWCRAHIADYKAPDRIVIVDDLPMTAMLKIDKAALSARVRSERSA